MANRSSPRSRQRGVGLVEISLAMVVSFTLLSAAVVAVKKNRDRALATELREEERLVFQAADEFYRSACRASGGTLPSSVSVATLQTQGYLPREPRSTWGATWAVSYLTSPRRAQITAVLNSAPLALVPWITDYAEGYSFTGITIHWIHNIRIVKDTTSASALEFKAMYEVPNC